jgi:hypothetical protein
MVTTKEMRRFASDCLKWADKETNPSHRETIFRAARIWFDTADMIDTAVANGRKLCLADLRSKLN